VTQSLRNARLAGNRIFFAFASALHEAIALLIAASSASDNFGAAAATDMNPIPLQIMSATVPAHRTLIGPSMMGSPATSHWEYNVQHRRMTLQARVR
jgi:hypothetical protein